MHKSIYKLVKKYRFFLGFLILLLIGLYLRFNKIEHIFSYGWDQGRDAWTIHDISEGKYVLVGPRTGIGRFHLGPLYYYLLLPFYYLTNFDPIASQIFNLVANIINFIIIFIVTKKIFSSPAALFAVFLYSINRYMIDINQTPWNVSLLPAAVFLLFYTLYRVLNGNYKYLVWTALLTGIFFQIHFTSVLMLLIVLPILVILPNKKSLFMWILKSLPVLFVWFIPNIIYSFASYHDDYYKYIDFAKYYFIGFHFRFMLHRLPDALIIFSFILHYPGLSVFRYVLPVLFVILILFYEKDKNMKHLGFLSILWLAAPLIGFTLYGGPLSDYYFLITLPAVFYIIIYLLRLMISFWRYSIIILVVFWGVYAFFNTRDYWNREVRGGLAKQKEEVRQKINSGEKIEYQEGDIKSYLYTVWVLDKRMFK